MIAWRPAAILGFRNRRLEPQDLLAVILLVFVPINFLYGAVLTHLAPPEKNDFTSYYVAGRMIETGKAASIYYPDPVGSLLAQASEQRPWIDVARAAGVANPNYYLYPPLFAVAFLPMSLVPYRIAFALWLLMNAGFLVTALAILMPPRGERRPIGLAACATLAGLFYPVWHHLKIGQSSLLVLLLLAATLALLRRRRDAAAGLSLALAILLKLTPAIFLVFLIMRRRFRATAAAAAGVIALSVLSAALTGWAPQVTYYTRMVPLLSAGTAFYPNQSFNGFLTRLAGLGDERKADLSLDLAGPRLAATAAGGALLALSLFLVWRRRWDAGPEADEDGFCLLVIAALLVSPISWEHHYVVVLLPAWVLIWRWSRGAAVERGTPWIAGAALALTGSYVGVAVFEKFGIGPLRPLLSSSAFLGGCALWALFARRGTRWGVGRSAPSSSRLEGLTAILVTISVFTGGQFLLKVAEYNTSFSYGDFTSYYVAAAAVAEGSGRALYQPGTPDPILAKAASPSEWRDIADRHGVRDANYYLYPPIFAVLASPLALLPYAAAHDVWYLLNLACLVGFLAWHLRRGRGTLTPAESAGAVILTAVMWPALFTFGAGQANYVILLLVFAAYVAVERRRPAGAGTALALAGAIKLTPGLLVAWLLWKGRYRAVIWTLAGLAGIAAAGIVVVGWEAHVIWLERMVPLLSRGCAHWVNQSVSAFLSRLAGADVFSWEIAPSSAWVRTGSVAISLLAILALLRLTRPGGESSLALEFSLVLVTTLFVSPISWIHHAVLSLPAIFFLIRHLVAADRLTPASSILLATSFTLIGIYLKPPGLFARLPLTPLASYHLLGQVLLWGLLAAEILRVRRASVLTGAAA